MAIVATLVSAMAFFGGYIAGQYGWWWGAFGLIVVYGAIYKFVDAGGHGGGKH